MDFDPIAMPHRFAFREFSIHACLHNLVRSHLVDA